MISARSCSSVAATCRRSPRRTTSRCALSGASSRTTRRRRGPAAVRAARPRTPRPRRPTVPWLRAAARRAGSRSGPVRASARAARPTPKVWRRPRRATTRATASGSRTSCAADGRRSRPTTSTPAASSGRSRSASTRWRPNWAPRIRAWSAAASAWVWSSPRRACSSPQRKTVTSGPTTRKPVTCCGRATCRGAPRRCPRCTRSTAASTWWSVPRPTSPPARSSREGGAWTPADGEPNGPGAYVAFALPERPAAASAAAQ